MNNRRDQINDWVKFVLPGYYLFYSRLVRKSERISWLVVFPFAVLVANMLVAPDDWTLILGIFLPSFLAWLAVYELGYLENDVFTIDREANPTLRISREEMASIKSNFYKIIGIRLLFFLLLTCLLWYFFADRFSLIYYFATIGLTCLAFYFHNRLRSRWNILTYFLLSSGKYLFLALTSFQLEFPLLLLALILVFPLPRTVEHACKVKYGLRPLKALVGEFDLFRVKYYGMGMIVFGFLAWGFPEEGWLIPMAVFVYFFLFRTFVWLLIKYASYQRTEFEVHQWDKE
jgi:hypothetical protein